MFYLLATTPTHKKGHTLSVQHSIHHITKVKIDTRDFSNAPNFDLWVTHCDYWGTETTQKMTLFFETFAVNEEILNMMLSDILASLVAVKTNPNNKANATE
jgi:hypothetical protein